MENATYFAKIRVNLCSNAIEIRNYDVIQNYIFIPQNAARVPPRMGETLAFSGDPMNTAFSSALDRAGDHAFDDVLL